VVDPPQPEKRPVVITERTATATGVRMDLSIPDERSRMRLSRVLHRFEPPRRNNERSTLGYRESMSEQLSRDAYERLKAEYEDLSTRGRIEVAEEIELARAEGDLKENAGYHAAKDKQGHMEGRIRQLEHLLENATVVDGARKVFTMIYEGDDADMAERFVIGSQEERDGLPADITIVGPGSPLGDALEGTSSPGPLEYEGPNGMLQVEILSIDDL